LQTQFFPSQERDSALVLIASVRENTVRDSVDNGYAQQVTASAGVVLVGSQSVPNPIRLRPYRTFREIEQPDSLCKYRLETGDEALKCCLFEADGGAWKRDAVRMVGQSLREQLGELYHAVA